MKRPSKRSLSSSIAIKFVTIIFVSNALFISVLFFVLRLQLAEKDQNIAIARYHEVAKVIEVSGLEKLKMETERGLFNKLEDLLIVIHDRADQRLFERMPRRLQNFDTEEVQKHLETVHRKDGISTIQPKELFEETIEMYSGSVSDYRLTVGINTDSSEDFLHLYFQMALIVTVISSLISVVLGYYTTKKALQPIRELITTVKSVQAGDWKTINRRAYSEDELAELTNLFNDMILQIQKLIGSLQTSLDSIAHDLRTPLTHISNKLESLLRGDDPRSTKDVAGDLMEEVQSISSLVNTLLEITEADSKSLSLRREDFSVEGLMRECVELYEYVSEEKKAIVAIDCDEGLIVNADRNRIKRVFANLIDNALKYSFENPRIFISCRRQEDCVVVSVEDNGVGIPESDLNKIWQRLYRGDLSRTTKGMGLGLSFVKSIIDAHGWTIIAEPGVNGSGARFVITIPCAPSNSKTVV